MYQGTKITTRICGLMESNKWKTPFDKTPPVFGRSPPRAFLRGGGKTGRSLFLLRRAAYTEAGPDLAVRIK
eukprot:587743-Prorocentrum_minimum.AAC.1